MTTTIALIVAGGSGARFGGERPKQYLNLAGQSVLKRSILAFARHPAITGVQVVIQPEHHTWYEAAIAGLDTELDQPLPTPVAGGASRQDSVRNGLDALAQWPAPPQQVLIHDAARPLVDAATIARVVLALADGPGAIAALPVVDTLKRASDGGHLVTVDRSGLWQAQTPQGFHFNAIHTAHRQCQGLALTDDAAVAEQAGLRVALCPGHPDNLKITSGDDLGRAARLLDALPPPVCDLRTGLGFDVHRFAADGDQVMLCGVPIAHTHGLEGHSDADVALHALTDAVLGAIAAGDIGQHFPPSDPRWRGADSARFLRHAATLAAARGGTITHVDVTLICEQPKIGPHRAAMVARLAEILGLASDRVSVKATTTERLGFTGRGEGIAAQAIATVRLP